MFRTDDTSQSSRGWLNLEAARNISRMLLTEETLSKSGWSKFTANRNMQSILLTDETSQCLRVWLKATACWNRKLISLTDETFHFPMGWLNDVASRNAARINTTEWISQFWMGWLKASAPRVVMTVCRSSRVRKKISHTLVVSCTKKTKIHTLEHQRHICRLTHCPL